MHGHEEPCANDDREILYCRHRQWGKIELVTDPIAPATLRSLEAACAPERERLTLAEARVTASPEDTEALDDLCLALMRLGDVELRTGEVASARERFQRARDVVRTLMDQAACRDPEAPSVPWRAADRDLFFRNLDLEERLAKTDQDRATALRELADTLYMYAHSMRRLGDLALSRGCFRRCIGVAEALALADPHDDTLSSNASHFHEELIDVEARSDNLAIVRDFTRRSLDLAEAQASVDSHDTAAQLDLYCCLHRLASVEWQAGNLAVVLELLRRALGISETLPETSSSDGTITRLADAELQVGNLVTARDYLLRSRDHATNVEALGYDDFFGLALRGAVESQAGNVAVARDLCQRALDLADTLEKNGSFNKGYTRPFRVLALDALGSVELRAGRLAAAREIFQRGLDLVDHDENSKIPRYGYHKRDLAFSLEWRGVVEQRAGELVAARAYFERLLVVTEAEVYGDPHSARARLDLALALDRLGDLERQTGELAAARSRFERALELRQAVAEADPHGSGVAFEVVLSLARLAELTCYEDDGDTFADLVSTANAHVAAMEAKGWVAGHRQREAIRERLQRWARDRSAEVGRDEGGLPNGTNPRGWLG